MPASPDLEKTIALAFCEGHLSTNPILIALHLQGPRVCVCECVREREISNEAIDWDFISEVTVSIKHVLNLEVKNITKNFINIDIITFMSYHLKGSLSFFNET